MRTLCISLSKKGNTHYGTTTMYLAGSGSICITGLYWYTGRAVVNFYAVSPKVYTVYC